MRKFILGLIVGATLMLTVPAIAGSGINNVSIANDTKLMVLGKQIDTDIVYGVLDTDQYGKNYVSARDLAEALGYKVDWDGATKTITVTEDGVGLNDPLGDSGVTWKELLLDYGYDIDAMYAAGVFDEIKENLELINLPDEVLVLLIADDYNSWLKGDEVLFGDFWSKVFTK